MTTLTLLTTLTNLWFFKALRLIYYQTLGIKNSGVKTIYYVDYAVYVEYNGYIGYRIAILLDYEGKIQVGKRLTPLTVLTTLTIVAMKGFMVNILLYYCDT